MQKIFHAAANGFARLRQITAINLPFAHAGEALQQLAEAGTAGYPPETKRRLMILNMIAYLIATTTTIYTIQNIVMDFERFRYVIFINFALISIMLSVPLLHRFGDTVAALVMLGAEYVALFCFVALLGRDSGLHIQLIVVAAAAFVVLGLDRLWLIVPTIIVAVVLHLAAWHMFPPGTAVIEVPPHVLSARYTQAAITTFALISASVYYAFRLVERARAQTDALLRNILPDEIVERLKAKPSDVVADNFQEASILFADITGFVSLARKLGAAKTVELLNTIVTHFDALAARHSIEKIKTIGDCYMAASGIPEPRKDHAERLADFALDMQASLEKLREQTGVAFDMRIGIAAGPIMAGVIGDKKFNYDVWGDPVNLAARLEGLSEPGEIHVCPQSAALLSEQFSLEPRGKLEIKGVGSIDTWFLAGRKSSG